MASFLACCAIIRVVPIRVVPALLERSIIVWSLFLIGRDFSSRAYSPRKAVLYILLGVICQTAFLGINAGHDRIAVIAHAMIDHSDFSSQDRHGHELIVDLIIPSASDDLIDHEHNPKVSFDLCEPFINCVFIDKGQISPTLGADQALDKPLFPLFKPPKNLA